MSHVTHHAAHIALGFMGLALLLSACTPTPGPTPTLTVDPGTPTPSPVAPSATPLPPTAIASPLPPTATSVSPLPTPVSPLPTPTLILLPQSGDPPTPTPELSGAGLAAVVALLTSLLLAYIPGFQAWWEAYPYKRESLAGVGFVLAWALVGLHYAGAVELHLSAFGWPVVWQVFEAWLAFAGMG